MNEVRETAEYSDWLSTLKDTKARARILVRMKRVEAGNFGDHKSVGDGVSELKFDFGPGYRAYYTIRGETVVFLLCGGDKDSQEQDIVSTKKRKQEQSTSEGHTTQGSGV